MMQLLHRCHLFVVCLLSVVLVLLLSKPVSALDAAEMQMIDDFVHEFPELAYHPYRWNNSAAVCQAPEGITCNAQDHITALDFLAYPLNSGSIPDSINGSSYLTSLKLACRHVTRALPSSLQYLASLNTLTVTQWFKGNTSEEFPQWLIRLPSLVSLNLNNFTFSANTTLGPLSGLTRLTTLSLTSCSLSGDIPDISALTYLETLFLDGNNFSGQIPPTIGNFKFLRNLGLGRNSLSGEIPSGIANITTLESINLSQNYLSGTIPNLTNIQNLRYCYLDHNNLQGNVSQLLRVNPTSLQGCSMKLNPLLVCPRYFGICCQDFNNTAPTTSSTTITTTITTSSTTRTASTTTSSGGCVGYQCQCSSNLTAISSQKICNSGTWVINGSAMNNNTLVVGQGDKIVNNGSFTQTEQGVLKIYTNSSSGGMQVTGNATLQGILIIIVTTAPATANMTTIQLINASNINGSFDSVQVIPEYEDANCYKISVQPIYQSTSFSALIITKNKCGRNNSKTVGVAVGVTLGLLFLIVLIAVIFVIWYQKKYRKPSRGSRAQTQAITQSIL